MRLQDLPIQQKLMRTILLTCGLVLLLVCIAFYTYEFFTFRDSIRQQTRSIARVVAANSTAALAFDSPNDAFEILSAFKAEPHVVAAGLYDANGNLFAKYPDSLSASVFPPKPTENGYYFTSDYLNTFQPVMQKKDFLGVLYIKSDLKALNERLLLYSGITILFILLSFLLAYVLSKILQTSISNPILKLSKTASIISNEHDYTVRAIKQGDDEIGLLTDAFNHMLSQIETQNNEITSFNHQLEEKVRQRTMQLENANTELAVVNEKLLKSNKDLEQFAYIASHDLQEPLRKILTFSGLVEKALPVDDGTHDYVHRIKQSAQRMTALIQSVLNYSRISRAEEETEMVSIEEVVRSILIDLELSLEEKKGVVNIGKLPVIEGNKLQLAQLFFNLLSNSLKFSDKPPVITITSETVTGNTIAYYPTAIKDEKYARISFSDNGIGFEQEYAAKVFSIFQRLHNKTQYPGTGIGLALCKKVVENHQGFIEVRSKEGEGTTFIIYLPLHSKSTLKTDRVAEQV
jgi:signal transduction histidine kinase